MPSTERRTTAYYRNFEQLLVDESYRNDWMGEKIPKPKNRWEIQAMFSSNVHLVYGRRPWILPRHTQQCEQRDQATNEHTSCSATLSHLSNARCKKLGLFLLCWVWEWIWCCIPILQENMSLLSFTFLIFTAFSPSLCLPLSLLSSFLPCPLTPIPNIQQSRVAFSADSVDTLCHSVQLSFLCKQWYYSPIIVFKKIYLTERALSDFNELQTSHHNMPSTERKKLTPTTRTSSSRLWMKGISDIGIVILPNLPIGRT